MRLLHTTTLEVVEVLDDAIPTYSILSHTWDADELSFQNIQTVEGRWRNPPDDEVRAIVNKKGFEKIKAAAVLAKRCGHAYIWIDTICIDKTSSAELSEAINSMHRWYQNAEECYAFLADVKPLEEEDLYAENSTFRTSRWFTRGWTLQELIAPKTVHFHACDWSFLGTKGKEDWKLRFTLSAITGIYYDVLDGTVELQDLSVASRMRWAANRKTTRVEDMAYCLMGIFDVNMPLLYGEGRKAFLRLQEEILRTTDDQSLFVWTTTHVQGEDTNDMVGLLASSPAPFFGAPQVHRLPPITWRESVPSSSTNQGLRVQLYLQRPDGSDATNSSEDYLALLDCATYVENEFRCPAIHLRRLWGDQFARIRPYRISSSPPPPAQDDSKLGYKTVFIRQKPIHIIPDFIFPSEESTKPFSSLSFEVMEVYPGAQWNPGTRTLKSKNAMLNGVMGVFRVWFKDLDDLWIDLVVGLRSDTANPIRLIPWCFQCRASDDATKTSSETFEHWDVIIRARRLDNPGFQDEADLGQDHLLPIVFRVVDTSIYGRSYLTLLSSERDEKN